MRCRIVLLAGKGRSRPVIAEGVGCSVSWVNPVSRFDQFGIADLMACLATCLFAAGYEALLFWNGEGEIL